MPVPRLTGRLVFPPVEQADPDGLVAVGGDLSVGRLLEAYRRARAAATAQLDERTEGLDATLGAGLTELFGKPGDFAALGRLEEAVARLGALDARLPRPPA